MAEPKVTIICPVYNEERYISTCIESIIAQDYLKEAMEVLFVDGRSKDNTAEIIKAYSRRAPYIRLLDNEHHTVPYALNKGIRKSDGDVVIRIDGHCTYPSDYVSTLVRYLYSLEADNVGAVWNTVPARDTAICHAIAIASSHPFGVGNSRHKIGASDIMLADTVPFGCYRRDVFDRIGLFDTDLTRNQDDELNARLTNHGGKIYLIPQLVINYTARDTIGKMSRMYYQYGLYKPLVNKKLGSPASMRQFFPLIWDSVFSHALRTRHNRRRSNEHAVRLDSLCIYHRTGTVFCHRSRHWPQTFVISQAPHPYGASAICVPCNTHELWLRLSERHIQSVDEQEV